MLKRRAHVIGWMLMIITLCSAILLTGCNNGPWTYEMLHDRAEISKVYLYLTSEVNANITYDLDKAIEVHDIDLLVEGLQELPFYETIYGDPFSFWCDYGIIIIYSNGDREYIHHATQFYVSAANGKTTHINWQCNPTKYDKFLQPFLNSAE